MQRFLFPNLSQYHNYRFLFLIVSFVVIGNFISGCRPSLDEVTTQNSERRREEKTPVVEVSRAKIKSLIPPVNYVGNTEPIREVSVRSRIEGRLLKLNVDLGDSVLKGDLLGELDDILLQTAISEAEAELAALKSEVTSARNEVANAQILVKQAEVELKQAQTDANRFQYLVNEGAISRQQAETATTNAEIIAQKLRSAQEQVRIKREAVVTAQQRVKAQEAILDEAQERLSYGLLISPIAGIVLEKLTETGNLLQPGTEVLKIGDFSEVKVVVPLTELKLKEIFLGQTVTVKLDAFANEIFKGKITRISPAANPQTRQIPIEITIPNPYGKIGSGLLARVELDNYEQEVVIPTSALQGNNKDTIFITREQEEDTIVEARQVILGKQSNNQVQIISGLNPDEPFVVRSNRSLKDGQKVLLSVLSESNQEKDN
jgi:RND family efflux transporter MFP subunit